MNETWAQWFRANIDKFLLLTVLFVLIHINAPEKDQMFGALLLALTGTPITFTDKGLTYWDSSTPRTGSMKVSANCTTGEGSSPSVICSNGTIASKIQADNNTGSVIVGSQSAHPACLVANNNDTAGICLHANGSDPYIPTLRSFANNAAAIIGGLVSGDLYQCADSICRVHP